MINEIIQIAQKAGDAILEIYNKDFNVEYKDDKSPLTDADKVSNEIITEALQKLTPQIPIISEENKLLDYQIRKDWTKCWLVDPIDGTKEFIKKNGANCWELDALGPDVIIKLIEDEIKANIDMDRWRAQERREQEGKALLAHGAQDYAASVSEQWLI